MFSNVTVHDPGYFVVRDRVKAEAALFGTLTESGLSVVRVVRDGSGGLWVNSETIKDAEKKYIFLVGLDLYDLVWNESLLVGLESCMGAKARGMVARMVAGRMNEGWPLHSDPGWAVKEGYLGSGSRPTKEGISLYESIARVVEDLDGRVDAPLISDVDI